MNNLESLVPPLELCKRIPAGKFKDSVFVWIANPTPGVDPWVCVRKDLVQKTKAFPPAPTLAEILAALPKFDQRENCLAVVPDFPDDGKTRVFGEFWAVGYTEKNSVKDSNPAAAALRLWMKVEGVEA